MVVSINCLKLNTSLIGGWCSRPIMSGYRNCGREETHLQKLRNRNKGEKSRRRRKKKRIDGMPEKMNMIHYLNFITKKFQFQNYFWLKFFWVIKNDFKTKQTEEFQVRKFLIRKILVPRKI